MANKFDVPPVQSTGILMQGLGQGLVEFGNVYGATKLATIEAEAQRNKEMRIMQMENIRNNMNDAFKYASYENDQERLQLARNADARAELSEGRAERSLLLQEEKAKQDAKVKYTFEKVPVFGWVELTEEEKDELGIETSTSKKVWKQTGTQLWAVNPYDPNDRYQVDKPVSEQQVDKPVSEQQVDTLFKVDSPNEFSSRSEAEKFIKDQIRATGGNPDNLPQSYMDKMLAKLIDSGEITISANGSSSNQSESGEQSSKSSATTSEDVYEFEGLTPEKDSAPWYEKQLIPANPTLSEVGEFIAEAVKEDNPQDNEIYARILGLPIDVLTSVINNVLMPKGSPMRSPVGGSAWLMKNRGLTVAQLVDMIKGAASSVVSENGEDSSQSALFGSPNRARSLLPSSEDASKGLLSRKDVLPIMETPPQEIVSPDDAMFIPTQDSGLLMPKGDSATVPDLGTGAYGEMPLDQPTNVSGPRLPTGDTGYMPPDNADMQYPQARQQAIDLVESMKNVNLPEDVIKAELLRLIEEYQNVSEGEENPAYAQALVDVYLELFGEN